MFSRGSSLRWVITSTLAVNLSIYDFVLAGDNENALNQRLEALERRIEQLEKQLAKQQSTMVEKTAKPGQLAARWNDGISLESSDNMYKFKLGGRIMNDWAWFSADQAIESIVGEQKDGTEVRRGRLYFSGTIYSDLFFKAEFDFSSSETAIKDLYIGWQNVPVVGHIKLGHFNEPFALERMTSSKYTTFMERALPLTFAPGKNSGIGIYNSVLNNRVTWAIGAYKDTDNSGRRQGDGSAITGRLTGLPWFEVSGEQLLHLGLSYSQRSTRDNEVRFRQRPEVHLSDRFVDTNIFSADQLDLIALESAFVYGPFSLQGEYIQADVDNGGGGMKFDGYYFFVSYFITGEYRPYNRSTGGFGRIKPSQNFTANEGWGAWEIALRYSELDLNDKEIQGGELNNISLGLNWYLNPNMRTMFNYIRSDLDKVGSMDSLQMRFQIDY